MTERLDRGFSVPNLLPTCAFATHGTFIVDSDLKETKAQGERERGM